ncbi:MULTISPECIES: hypothetical protein [unclassified Caballeronia]|uniref:hypothetical protein n=1 Tax=unclassified Caballeronia TaxID=2646786 RepID=UPI0020292BFF|nr:MULTISPECIES: hypothetical protein [unclassified Caballeronia]
MSNAKQAAAYYAANRQKVLKKRQERYRANIEAERDYQKRYYEQNRDAILLKHRQKREARDVD